MDVNERQKSEFNMAVSYLNRLNNLFYVCDKASIELDSHMWFHSLMAIYRELSTEITKEPERKRIKEIATKLSQAAHIYRNSQNKGKDRGLPDSLYWQLHDFELELREVLEKSGLQTKRQDDASFALG